MSPSFWHGIIGKDIREGWRIAAISVVIIALCGLKFTYGIEKIIDITLYDESYYLQSGVNLLKNGLPAADQAPVYAIWYFILSRFITNNIDLYYLNYKILTILPIILMYLVLYKFKKPWLISILAALYLLISRANLPVFVKVSHFALCIILFFLMISQYYRSRLLSLLILTVGVLLASYVRPEFFLSFVILSVMTIITFFKDENRISYKYEVGSYVILLGIVFLLIWTLGFPMAWQGKRLWVALGQHFAVNYGKWHGVADSPWNTWLTTWQGTFGNTESILAAFYSNPFNVN